MRVRDQNADILHRILGDPMFRTVLPGEKKVQCGSGQNEKCCAWKVRPTPDGMSAKAGTEELYEIGTECAGNTPANQGVLNFRLRLPDTTGDEGGETFGGYHVYLKYRAVEEVLGQLPSIMPPPSGAPFFRTGTDERTAVVLPLTNNKWAWVLVQNISKEEVAKTDSAASFVEYRLRLATPGMSIARIVFTRELLSLEDSENIDLLNDFDKTTDWSLVPVNVTFRTNGAEQVVIDYHLQPSTPHSFQIRAFNSIGPSEFVTSTDDSPAGVVFETKELGLIPAGKPTNIRVFDASTHATTGGLITLAWTPPMDQGGDCVVGYQVKAWKSGQNEDTAKIRHDECGRDRFTAAGTCTSNTRYHDGKALRTWASMGRGNGGFDAGKEYMFRVRAVTDGGSGTTGKQGKPGVWSEPQTFQMGTKSNPKKPIWHPTPLEPNGRRGTQLTVSFDGNADDGGADLHSYKVELCDQGPTNGETPGACVGVSACGSMSDTNCWYSYPDQMHNPPGLAGGGYVTPAGRQGIVELDATVNVINLRDARTYSMRVRACNTAPCDKAVQWGEPSDVIVERTTSQGLGVLHFDLEQRLVFLESEIAAEFTVLREHGESGELKAKFSTEDGKDGPACRCNEAVSDPQTPRDYYFKNKDGNDVGPFVAANRMLGVMDACSGSAPDPGGSTESWNMGERCNLCRRMYDRITGKKLLKVQQRPDQWDALDASTYYREWCGAREGWDYVPKYDEVIAFGDRITMQTINVSIINDYDCEFPNELFSVVMSNFNDSGIAEHRQVANTTVRDGQGIATRSPNASVTIADDLDAGEIQFTIGEVSTSEKTGTTGKFPVTVTRVGGNSGATSVHWYTEMHGATEADGLAKPGRGRDDGSVDFYANEWSNADIAPTQTERVYKTLTFPDQSSEPRVINMYIWNDERFSSQELEEKFTVYLKNRDQDKEGQDNVRFGTQYKPLEDKFNVALDLNGEYDLCVARVTPAKRKIGITILDDGDENEPAQGVTPRMAETNGKIIRTGGSMTLQFEHREIVQDVDGNEVEVFPHKGGANQRIVGFDIERCDLSDDYVAGPRDCFACYLHDDNEDVCNQKCEWDGKACTLRARKFPPFTSPGYSDFNKEAFKLEGDQFCVRKDSSEWSQSSFTKCDPSVMVTGANGKLVPCANSETEHCIGVTDDERTYGPATTCSKCDCQRHMDAGSCTSESFGCKYVNDGGDAGAHCSGGWYKQGVVSHGMKVLSKDSTSKVVLSAEVEGLREYSFDPETATATMFVSLLAKETTYFFRSAPYNFYGFCDRHSSSANTCATRPECKWLDGACVHNGRSDSICRGRLTMDHCHNRNECVWLGVPGVTGAVCVLSGQGEWSKPAEFQTDVATGPLSAVAPKIARVNNGEVEALSGGALVISWEPPGDSGGIEIQSYELFMRGASTGFSIVYSEAESKTSLSRAERLLPRVVSRDGTPYESTSILDEVKAVWSHPTALSTKRHAIIGGTETHFQAGQPYTFAVRANNEEALGQRSKELTVTMKNAHAPSSTLGRTGSSSDLGPLPMNCPRELPESYIKAGCPAVTLCESTTESGGSLLLSWEKPFDRGGQEIARYWLEYDESQCTRDVSDFVPLPTDVNEDGVELVGAAPATTNRAYYIQKGLLANSNYRFRIAAEGNITKNGCSHCLLYSSVLAFRTGPESPSKPPRNVRQIANTGGSVTITWDAPLDTGGVPVSDLTYSVYITGGGERGAWVGDEFKPSGTGHSHGSGSTVGPHKAIDPPRKIYEGISPKLPAKLVFECENIPDVSFGTGASTGTAGGGSTRNGASCTVYGWGQKVCREGQVCPGKVNIERLKMDTNYYVYVQAINRVGQCNPATVVTYSTATGVLIQTTAQATPPGPPKSMSLSKNVPASGGKLVLAWQEPLDMGGLPILRYHLYLNVKKSSDVAAEYFGNTLNFVLGKTHVRAWAMQPEGSKIVQSEMMFQWADGSTLPSGEVPLPSATYKEGYFKLVGGGSEPYVVLKSDKEIIVLSRPRIVFQEAESIGLSGAVPSSVTGQRVEPTTGWVLQGELSSMVSMEEEQVITTIEIDPRTGRPTGLQTEAVVVTTTISRTSTYVSIPLLDSRGASSSTDPGKFSSALPAVKCENEVGEQNKRRCLYGHLSSTQEFRSGFFSSKVEMEIELLQDEGTNRIGTNMGLSPCTTCPTGEDCSQRETKHTGDSREDCGTPPSSEEELLKKTSDNGRWLEVNYFDSDQETLSLSLSLFEMTIDQPSDAVFCKKGSIGGICTVEYVISDTYRVECTKIHGLQAGEPFDIVSSENPNSIKNGVYKVNVEIDPRIFNFKSSSLSPASGENDNPSSHEPGANDGSEPWVPAHHRHRVSLQERWNWHGCSVLRQRSQERWN